MKKIITLIIALMAMATMGLALVSCGSSIEGEYKFSEMTTTIGEKTETVKVGDEYDGVTLTADLYTLTVNKDGTFVMEAKGEKKEGTWKKDGSNYKFTVDEESIEVKLSGKKLTMTESDDDYGYSSTIVFKKK